MLVCASYAARFRDKLETMARGKGSGQVGTRESQHFAISGDGRRLVHRVLLVPRHVDPNCNCACFFGCTFCL